MEETRALAGRLESLSRPELEQLDALTRAIAVGVPAARRRIREARRARDGPPGPAAGSGHR